jgi:hypothetical protein
MSFETVESKLGAWKAAQTPQVDKQVPVEATKDSIQPTEEPAKQDAVEAPTEQPKEEPTEKPVEVIQQESSWDADETQTTVETPKYDFSKIGSALDLKEIKGEDEIVAKVSELKTKIKEYEEKPLTGIPDDFKEVLEVTKSGGNWKDYLASQIVDYTKVDPIQLFEDSFFQDAVKNPKYFTDGKFDQAKAEEAVDLIPESLREMYGKQIAHGKIQEQRQRQLEIKAKAEARLASAEKSLSTATKNLNELLPVESYGIKFEPKHSSEIYQGIANSKLTKELLGVSYEDLVKSGADMKAVAKTIAAAKYMEKMLKYKSQTSKAEAKKEVLDKIQNPQIRSTGSNVQPESETKRELTPAEKLAIHYKNQHKGL